VAATEIQRVVRGKLQRKSYKKTSSRLSRRLTQEKERSVRLRRIRAQEKELAILRHLPVQDFLNFDKLRKGGCAKIIQRFWRKKRLTVLHKRVVNDNKLMRVEALRADDDRAVCRLQETLKSIRDSSSLEENPDDGMLDYSNRGYPDAMKLMELLDRIKESAKQKHAEREYYNLQRKEETTKKLDTLPMQYEAKSNPRKKYSDYFQSRQQVSVIVEDYMIERENWRRDQLSRVTEMNRCRRLIEDCSQPMSLSEASKILRGSGVLGKSHHNSVDENSEGKQETKESGIREGNEFVTKMFQDLPPVTTDSYLQSIGRYQQAVRAHREESKWGYVNVSHIGLLNSSHSGPINLRDLDYTISDVRNLNRRKKVKKALTNEEESIAWITYASQDSRRIDTAVTGNDAGADDDDAPKSKIDHKDMLLTATERNANALLGEVEGRELLQNVCKKSLISREKQQALIMQECARVVEKRDKLAEIYCMQSLALQRKALYDGTQAGKMKYLSYEEMRNERATKIQAVFRAKKGREFARHLRAENRVMSALRVLVSELTQPELQGKQHLLHLEKLLVTKSGQDGESVLGTGSSCNRFRRPGTHESSNNPPMSSRSVKHFSASNNSSVAPRPLSTSPRASDENVFLGDQRNIPDTVAGYSDRKLSPSENSVKSNHGSVGHLQNSRILLKSTPRSSTKITSPVLQTTEMRRSENDDNVIVITAPHTPDTRRHKANHSLLTPMSSTHRTGGESNENTFADGYISPPSMSHSDIQHEMNKASSSPRPTGKPSIGSSGNKLNTFHEESTFVNASNSGHFGSALNFGEDDLEVVTPFSVCTEIPSERSIRMMKNVEKKVRQGRTLLAVSGLLDIGLTVNTVSSFDKHIAYQFLLQLCIPYGPVALIRWLLRQSTGEGSEEQDRTVPVELVVLFLGELAVELGVLNEAINRISGEEEDVASMKSFCEFCMLIKLISAGCKCADNDTEAAMVPLQDLQCILEEEWLKFVPSNGNRYVA
jgi:hypothetical protein